MFRRYTTTYLPVKKDDNYVPWMKKRGLNDYGVGRMKNLLGILIFFIFFARYLPIPWRSIDIALNHAFYQVLSSMDIGEVTCMNYGYKDLSSDAGVVEMDTSDEPERYCLQMYHKLGSSVGDLTGLDVLEVGSGRGGGSSYIKRFLHPKSMMGLDYSSKAVDFCKENHSKNIEGLSFVQGDAQHLPFEDNKFDVVFNVESSHCYGDFDKFLGEVHRVLKPGGHFTWVDFRTPSELPRATQAFSRTGFIEIKSEDVTANVLASMNVSTVQKKELIDSRVPKIFRGVFYMFAGIEGTKLYNQFLEGRLEYTHKLLKKSEL